MARSFAHPPAALRVGDQAVDCFPKLFGIAWRHGDRLDAVAGDLRNGGVERGVDDRPPGRHGFQLDEPESFRIAHRRHRKHIGDAHQFDAFALRDGAEQANAILNAEALYQLFEPQPFATLADDPDLERPTGGGANQYVKTLVGNEPAAGQHQPSARVE